jgi:hypothetical protein
MPGNSAKVRRGGSGKNEADYFINYSISPYAQLCFNHYFARISGIFQERGSSIVQAGIPIAIGIGTFVTTKVQGHS